TKDGAVGPTGATAPGDYVSGSGVVTFAVGETSKPVNVSINGDTAGEANETFTVELSSAVNALITKAIGKGTIKDDDSLSDPPAASVAGVAVNEGAAAGSVTLKVSLSHPSSQTVSVSFATSDGTAHAPADYTAVTDKVLTFAPAKTTQTVAVPLINDILDEDNETFNATLSAPQNAAIDAVGGTAVVTINDNDAMPTVSIGDASTVEGNSSSHNLNFTISLSALSGRDVKVTAKTANASAVAPGDFTAKSMVVTMPAGTTTAVFSVPVKGETTIEPDETFTVGLTTLVSAT